MEDVDEVLMDIGVRMNLKGYVFIRYGLELLLDDPSYIGAVTKRLYPAISVKFNSTNSRVERAIRHAIDETFTSPDIATNCKMFGNTIKSSKGKPENSLFLVVVSSYIRSKRGTVKC